MDTLIVGAGAIGSLMAWRLGTAGHKVTAVARAPYVRAVKRRGLLVEQDGRATRADGLEVLESTDELRGARFDLVLITTKAYDMAVAAVQAQPFVERGAQAVLLQNGVGSIEVARTILDEERLVAGTLTIPVEMRSPAVVSPRLDGGGLGFAPVVGTVDVTSLAQLFEGSGFEVRTYRDWRTIRWSKLMLNMLANAIPAILDRPVEQAYTDRRLYELERVALREARAVAKRLGARLVRLPGYPVPLLVWALCSLPAAWTYPLFLRSVVGSRGGKRPSLHIDLARGRTRSEVDYLNGAVVRAGEKLGVPTPANRVLCETLTGIARGELAWIEYKGQTERLLRRSANGTVHDPSR